VKIGVICSAGGSSFFSAFDLLYKSGKVNPEDFFVVTDRVCGAKLGARSRCIPHENIPFTGKTQFSIDVANCFNNQGIDVGIMLYSRLVTKELFDVVPLLNIHPALLPGIKGMNAVEQALTAKVKFIGATIHLTTAKMDDGDIIGQVINPVREGVQKNEVNKTSFLQKTYLVAMVVDSILTGYLSLYVIKGVAKAKWNGEPSFSQTANPQIQSEDLRELFARFQKDNSLLETDQ